MKRTFIIGLFAMVIGGIGLFVCEQMGVNPQNTIFGVGTGVIAAIVRIGTPIERLVATSSDWCWGPSWLQCRLGSCWAVVTTSGWPSRLLSSLSSLG